MIIYIQKQAYRKAHGKELTCDASLEFEKRRNEPVKYSRKLYQDTMESIPKIEKIRQKREAHHILSRLAKAKEIQHRADLWEVDTNLKVIQAPAVQDERLRSVVKVSFSFRKLNHFLVRKTNETYL